MSLLGQGLLFVSCRLPRAWEKTAHSRRPGTCLIHGTSLVAQTVKASTYNVRDLGSIPGSGKSPGEGNGNPFQYSCLENPMYKGARWATVHEVAKSQLSNFTFTFTSWMPKAIVFPLVRYGYKSWTIKKVQCWRIYAFKLWCWRRLLRVPWTARRSNQSILKEINMNIHQKDWRGSWNSNTLAIWCEELTHWKRPWCWERLKAGDRDNRGWDGWMASLSQWTWVWVSSGSWWWTGRPGVLQSMGSQRIRYNLVTEQ